MEGTTFVPDLKLAIFLPPLERFRSKFGGFPWGISPEQWPVCPNCDRHESFVGQLEHDDKALPLGAKNRVLQLFWCLSPQCVGVPDEVKNKCFLLESLDVSMGPTKPPSSVVALCEAIVLGWVEKPDKDEIGPSPEFDVFEGLNEQQRRSLFVYSGTKAGGIPYGWNQSESVKDSWNFAMQIEGRHLFSGTLPSQDSLGCSIGQWASPKQEMLKREKHPGHPTSAFKGFGETWYSDFFPAPGWPLATVYLEERNDKLPACYLVSGDTLMDSY